MVCSQESAIWIYFTYEQCSVNRGTKHFIIKLRRNICKTIAFNHRTIESIINCQHFCHFASTYRKSSTILKKPVRSTPVTFDRRDRRTPASLPRSNEATGRVTKGRAAQLAYAGLANEVVLLASIMFNGCLKLAEVYKQYVCIQSYKK